MSDPALAEKMPGEDNIAVGWLMRKKLASMSDSPEGKLITLNDNGKSMLTSVMSDEELVNRMSAAPVPESEADPKIIKDLKGRKGMIKETEVTAREISLTPDGVEAARSGLEVKEEEADVVPHQRV